MDTTKNINDVEAIHIQDAAMKKISPQNIKNYVETIIAALKDKKAENIQVIDISNVSAVADYFIIANGTNTSQIQALSDNVEEKLAALGAYPKHIEGYHNANWILMDYLDILVHIFDKESRGFYDLERLWRDGTVVELSYFENSKALLDKQ